MSCFVHHMIRKGIFYEMEVPASEENAEKLQADLAEIVGMRGRECYEIWSEVSAWLDDPKLKEQLRQKLLSRHPPK